MSAARCRRGVVVGGSNGVGLALSLELLRRGCCVEIVDRVPPEGMLLETYRGQWNYRASDLANFDVELFDDLSNDSDTMLLFITAGLGRVAAFEDLQLAEIDKLLGINALAAIKIIHCFYYRLRAGDPFYCGVMGSIAGLVSSPLFSVYAASKAALCRFTESVNIELEVSGSPNRILTVAPGSLAGTCFNGGGNDLSRLGDLPAEIITRLERHATLYIPQYQEVFAGVLQRYQHDPHAFGLDSYAYKQKEGRARRGRQAVIGYLSGTFDLFHIGHLNLLRRAKGQCDYLIVGVHASGAWKGKETYIPLEERMAILAACRYVDQVVVSENEDCDAWDKYHYDKLFVGSDYKGTERFARYEAYFQDKGVEIVYFPYTQGTSSSKLRAVLAVALQMRDNGAAGSH